MLTKQANPFRNKLVVTYKQLQVLKMREYIYNYLCKLDGISEEEACEIANTDAQNRLNKTRAFNENDLRYINGRLEEIEKLNFEINNILISVN
jgi:hypothetical protein